MCPGFSHCMSLQCCEAVHEEGNLNHTLVPVSSAKAPQSAAPSDERGQNDVVLQAQPNAQVIRLTYLPS